MATFAWFVLGFILGLVVGYASGAKKEDDPEDVADLEAAIDRVKAIDPDPNNPKKE